MFGIGVQELLIVLVILLLLFGGKKLPELSKSIGTAIMEFKNALTGGGDSKTKDDKKTKPEK